MTPLRLTAATGALALGAATLGLLSPASAATVRYCHGARATIVLAPHQRNAVGTNHRDVILGNAEFNRIRGRGGDDVICGRDGPDTIFGGKGADHLYGGAGIDTLEGGRGDDIVDAGSRLSSYVNRIIEGPGDDRDILAARDDLFFFRHFSPAEGRPVEVDLQAGTATGQGHDRLIMGRRTAQVFVPPGSTVHGSRHADSMAGDGATLYGGPGKDYLLGTGSEMHGNAGGDAIEGYSSTDHPFLGVYGGPGSDGLDVHLRPGDDATIDGGTGSDFAGVDLSPSSAQATPWPTVDLDLTSHLAVGSSTWPFTGIEDVILSVQDGVANAVTSEGTDGPDWLKIFAGKVPVTVHALGGDDQITTDAGDDTVDGGNGTDSANTAGGNDICISVETPTHCESVGP